ncbi:MAG: hypothetical protein JSR77_17555 [Planctomycetes bacterium]|nr:hypothetical protein [Planctomycetota bacterium]
MHAINRSISCLFLAAAALAGGCESSSTIVKKSDLVGEWVGPANRKIAISDLGAERFEVTRFDADAPKGFAGKLVSVDGFEFAQFEAARQEGSVNSIKPIFSYMRLDREDNRVLIRRVNNTWLKAAAAETPGAVYTDLPKSANGTGGVSWDTEETRTKLLRKATLNPNAFAAPESFLRLK